ncbi:hypothetical protein ACFW9D_16715 [Streptomyces sp. NPDC059524]|uniref:hypothetical protein n=1 Tax=Streptomyces sp. NPDC059524 TaxID=3346856 RepID=UPI0036B6F304
MRAPRCVLAAAVAMAACSGPIHEDRNRQYVQQRTAAQCAEEIGRLNEARFEDSVRAAEERSLGVAHLTAFAVDASCGDAIDAASRRCLREAEQVRADRQPEDPAVTEQPPRDKALDDSDPDELLAEVHGFSTECGWAVLDVLTGRRAHPLTRP